MDWCLSSLANASELTASAVVAIQFWSDPLARPTGAGQAPPHCCESHTKGAAHPMRSGRAMSARCRRRMYKRPAVGALEGSEIRPEGKADKQSDSTAHRASVSLKAASEALHHPRRVSITPSRR